MTERKEGVQRFERKKERKKNYCRVDGCSFVAVPIRDEERHRRRFSHVLSRADRK